MPGVVSSTVGYTGGLSPNPSYESVCNGDGHTEALRIVYDPEVLGFEKLMTLFFARARSPRWGVAVQYRHAVWPQNDEQAETARKVAQQMSSRVPILPETAFYDAEDYHQKYLESGLGCIGCFG